VSVSAFVDGDICECVKLSVELLTLSSLSRPLALSLHPSPSLSIFLSLCDSCSVFFFPPACSRPRSRSCPRCLSLCAFSLSFFDSCCPSLPLLCSLKSAILLTSSVSLRARVRQISVLQCVAVCCSVLQCVAVSRSLACIASMYCVCCRVLQRVVAVCLQCFAVSAPSRVRHISVLQCFSVFCSVVCCKCVAVCCSVLQARLTPPRWRR